MYIILNYRGTKEYAEKSEVRGKRVSFPRQSSHLCLPRLKQDCSLHGNRGAKTRLLAMETEGLSHTLLQGLRFLGVEATCEQDRRVQHVSDKTQHAFWRTRSFLKTGDTTWTPCGAVNRKGMASGSSQARLHKPVLTSLILGNIT